MSDAPGYQPVEAHSQPVPAVGPGLPAPAPVTAPAGAILRLQRAAGNRATAQAVARWKSDRPGVRRQPGHHRNPATPPRRRLPESLREHFDVQAVVPAAGGAPAPAAAPTGAVPRPLDAERPLAGAPDPAGLWSGVPAWLRPRNTGSLGVDVQASVGQNLAVFDSSGSPRGPSLQQGDTSFTFNVLAVSREFRWLGSETVNGIFEPNGLLSVATVPHGVDPDHWQFAVSVATDLLHVKVGEWLDLHLGTAQATVGVDVPVTGGSAQPFAGGQASIGAEVALPNDSGTGPSDRFTLTLAGFAQVQRLGSETSEALGINLTLTGHVLRAHGVP